MRRGIVFPQGTQLPKMAVATDALARGHRMKPVSAGTVSAESWRKSYPDFLVAEPDLTPERVALIQSSFASVVDRTAPGLVGKSDGYFPQRFYELLFEHYPTLRPLFKNPKKQPRMLFSMLQRSTDLLDKDMSALVEDLTKLGQRHHAYHTEPEHYNAVGDTLIKTLKEALGEQMNAETTEAWNHLYGFMCQIMMPITAQMIEDEKAKQPTA